MSKRIAVFLAALTAGIVILTTGSAVSLAQEKAKATKRIYAHDFRVRPGGASDFNSKTPKLGVECFHDEANGAMIAISQTGGIAVVPLTSVGTETTPKWLGGHDVRVRKAGEAETTQKTKQVGIEVFEDPASKRLLYIDETGSLSFAPLPTAMSTDKGPKKHHALEAKVRGPEEQNFEKAKKLGIEVFKDENTGGLIYITETGSLATAPAPAKAPDKDKVLSPKALYGLVLRVRAAKEADFSDNTKKFGIDVFEDPNSNALFFLSESGDIATAPKPAMLTGTRGVTWKSAMSLPVRKAGEKSLDKADRFGIEVFQDNQTGDLVYISETGSIAVLPK